MSLSNEQTENAVQPKKDPLWSALLLGFVPLLLLSGIGLITLLMLEVIRQLSTPAGFVVAQRNVLITLGIGLALTITGYVSAIVFLVRHLRVWRETGQHRRATVVVWSLATTAVVILIPIILAAVMPQHPAP